MKKKNLSASGGQVDEKDFAIPYKNIMYIAVAFGVMVLGYVIMAGGGSDDPNQFNEAMFSFRRIVVAPVVILAGMIMVIAAIMYRGKKEKK